ncbi:MAG TPA: hypothetical protein VGQ62_08720 [Chloroflexota bacterium]|nr:hypothetical protein [Chloroflexota bacterium]
MKTIIEADYFTSGMDQKLAPEPFVAAGVGQGFELSTALGQEQQKVSKPAPVRDVEYQRAGAEAGAVGRVGDDRHLH